tara:strand:+ start:378 stop:1235 length:858 start_codon:yes stop_codon:yes gene_type:complete
MKEIEIAFIGGSGLYKLPNLEDSKWISISSEFGNPSSKIRVGTLNGKKIAFLPRHGLDHNISPSKINYRANIDALKKLNVQNIVSISAVGSLREDFKPMDFVLVDQFIDKTYLRKKTFFDDDCVVHIPMSSPVCKNLVKKCSEVLKRIKLDFHNSGTYICIEGPQFSTLAESNLYRSWGCDVIGMTNMPEAKLAREAGICYASLSMVTDYDCWHPEHNSVTVDQIIQTMNENSSNALKLINEICKEKRINCDNETKEISNNSLITNRKKIKDKTKKKLSNILEDL